MIDAARNEKVAMEDHCNSNLFDLVDVVYNARAVTRGGDRER
jgi:hypothetical protein